MYVHDFKKKYTNQYVFYNHNFTNIELVWTFCVKASHSSCNFVIKPTQLPYSPCIGTVANPGFSANARGIPEPVDVVRVKRWSKMSKSQPRLEIVLSTNDGGVHVGEFWGAEETRLIYVRDLNNVVMAKGCVNCNKQFYELSKT